MNKTISLFLTEKETLETVIDRKQTSHTVKVILNPVLSKQLQGGEN